MRIQTYGQQRTAEQLKKLNSEWKSIYVTKNGKTTRFMFFLYWNYKDETYELSIESEPRMSVRFPYGSPISYGFTNVKKARKEMNRLIKEFKDTVLNSPPHYYENSCFICGEWRIEFMDHTRCYVIGEL